MPDESQQMDTTPPEGGTAQPEPSISFDVDDLLGAGTAPNASAEPVTPEAPASSGEEDGAGDDETADGDPLEDADDPETAEGEDERPPEQRLFEFATFVAQNPNRIDEVPKKLRPEVIKSLLSAAYLRGKNDSGSEFQPQSSAEERLRAFVTERGEARRADPDGFSQWEQDNPADAARYHQGIAHFKEKAAPPAEEPQTANPAAIQQRANAKLARVSALPDGARDQFVARVQSGEFPLTEAGLDAMEDALFAAATMRPAAPAPAAATVPPTAARRQAAAAARAEAPRPKGVGAGGQPVPEAIYDPDALFAMSR
mgnify:CR=1 FL=1